MATPAEVANDLASWANYYDRRDDGIARVCRDGEKIIRDMLGGKQADGRTYGGVHKRLLNRTGQGADLDNPIIRSLSRARTTIELLRADQVRASGGGFMTAARTTCLCPGCRRTTAKAYDEMICGKHWRAIPKELRQRRSKLLRLAKRDDRWWPEEQAAWEACKAAAIAEALTGIAI